MVLLIWGEGSGKKIARNSLKHVMVLKFLKFDETFEIFSVSY